MLLGVDVGGTFTDAVLVVEEADAQSRGAGRIHTAKVPSTPEDQSQGVMQAIHAVMERAGAEPGEVGRLAHGMTVATNALLEGRVARTALVATEGFTDVVELGRQARASLYRLCEAGPAPLVPTELRFGAPERMTPEGVLRPLDRERAQALVEEIAQARPQAVAVVLLHSWADPMHELRLGEMIGRRLPETAVVLSHELVGTWREYERAASTEVDAALSPLLAGYLRGLSRKTQDAGLPRLQVMQSSGGLIDRETAERHAALTVLSGPAGGVGGARLLAEAAGEPNVLCVDMGGTSCDVCTIEEGRIGETTQRSVAGRPLALPALDIDTVGAGGGSIAWRDAGGALRVGPQSAGAEPGPACYGRGGSRPTVTDANVVLGRLAQAAPLAGGVSVDEGAARRVVAGLAEELEMNVETCAEGIVRVAESEMSRALRRMTVERGVDPRRFALMAFGGAGGLHAAALASELGIERVLCPRASGVLCALGLAAAAPRRDATRTVALAEGELTGERVRDEREALVRRVRAELGEDFFEEEGRWAAGQRPGRAVERAGGDWARGRVVYEMRYRGQSFELDVERGWPREGEAVDVAGLRASFERAHEERYGYCDEEAEVELVTIRVSAWGVAPEVRLAGVDTESPRRTRQRVVVDGEEGEAECRLGELEVGAQVTGPAVCALPEATVWVPPGWRGKVDAQGTMCMRKTVA